MSEIKVLFCAPTRCTSPETVRPEISSCTLLICSYNNWLKKGAHTGCTPPKIVHPAVKMCAPGAGCTLNFGHCHYTYTLSVFEINDAHGAWRAQFHHRAQNFQQCAPVFSAYYDTNTLRSALGTFRVPSFRSCAPEVRTNQNLSFEHCLSLHVQSAHSML